MRRLSTPTSVISLLLIFVLFYLYIYIPSVVFILKLKEFILLFPFAVSAFTDYIKNLSPSTLDVELRMLQIIDDEDLQNIDQRPELHSIGLLLDYFVHELSSRNNFEFIQAVIRLFLKVWINVSFLVYQ